MDINQFFRNFVELLIKENIFEDNENLKEKLSNAISKYTKDGIISKEFNEILVNLFGVYDTVAREVMIPRTDMIAVQDNISLEELIKVFSEHKKSKIPVYKDNIDNIIGIVNVKDIISYWADNGKNFNIKDVLRPPYFIPETKKILDLLKEFKNKKTLFAIVVDEFGGVSGIVTIVDVLEEIVGDFDYEEEESPEIQKIDKNTYLVDAKMNIEDLEEELGLKFKEGPYDSIGGFIIKELGKIPEKGEKFELDNAEIIVNEAFERGVKNLIIKLKETYKD